MASRSPPRQKILPVSGRVWSIFLRAPQPPASIFGMTYVEVVLNNNPPINLLVTDEYSGQLPAWMPDLLTSYYSYRKGTVGRDVEIGYITDHGANFITSVKLI